MKYPLMTLETSGGPMAVRDDDMVVRLDQAGNMTMLTPGGGHRKAHQKRFERFVKAFTQARVADPRDDAREA